MTLKLSVYIEDLTCVVISYDQECKTVYHDLLKCNFITFKMNIISIRNTLLSWTLSMTLCVHAIVSLYVWSYDFHDTTLATE